MLISLRRVTQREAGGMVGGKGTIRSGRPLMLSICPHLGDTTFRATPCTPMEHYIVLTRPFTGAWWCGCTCSSCTFTRPCIRPSLCAHTFYAAKPFDGACVYISTVRLFIWSETMGLLTPALNDTIASPTTWHPCHRNSHLASEGVCSFGKGAWVLSSTSSSLLFLVFAFLLLSLFAFVLVFAFVLFL